MDALERLQMYSGMVQDDEFSLEEQMDSAEDASADLLDGITDNSQPNKIQEVSYEPEPEVQESHIEEIQLSESDSNIEQQQIDEQEEDTTQEEIMENTREEIVQEEIKEETTTPSRRGRPSKKQNVDCQNVVYNNIIRNFIEELRKKKQTTQGLDNKTMDIIYDYMLTKF